MCDISMGTPLFTIGMAALQEELQGLKNGRSEQLSDKLENQSKNYYRRHCPLEAS